MSGKDYVDLYFILRELIFSELLIGCEQKFPQIDKNLILKSLVYFDDMDAPPLHFMPQKEVGMEEIKEFLKNQVKTYTTESI